VTYQIHRIQDKNYMVSMDVLKKTSDKNQYTFKIKTLEKLGIKGKYLNKIKVIMKIP
jgi:hypothetical protein